MSTFSYTKGKRIAKIVGGKQNGRVVHLYDSTFKCCPSCSSKCQKKRCCDKCALKDYHSNYTQEGINMLLERIKQGQPIEIDEEIEIGEGKLIKSITLHGGQFQQCPSNQPRICPDLMYVSGRRGSGKSFYIAMYLAEFVKMYPRYRIYLFSQKQQDDLLDKYITKRIDTQHVIDAQLEAKDFTESLVIFDDVDSLPCEKGRDIRAAVYNVMTDVIETGRSLGVFCIVTSHLTCNAGESKRIINACTSFTFFLNSSTHQTNYALQTYFGFSRKQVKKLLAVNEGRFVTIYRDCPQVAMTTNKIMFQSEIENEL